MFSSFPFLRYGHQTADIKPFPKLTSARLFSQEPRKKLSLRRHKASLKIFEDKACKVPIKSSFFVAFIELVKTLFISTSSLSHGDKPDRFSLLAGRRYGRAEFQRRGLGKTGTRNLAKIGTKISKRATKNMKFDKEKSLLVINSAPVVIQVLSIDFQDT